MSEPMHIMDKMLYTALALYCLALFAGLMFGPSLPYEQAKRVEWWVDTLVSIPFLLPIYFIIAIMAIAPFVIIYVVWIGAPE